MYRTRCGFTLIELLVVIAIIAILAAILFPVFIAAKQQAQKTTCINNLKQLSSAFQIYADDNGNCIPLAYTECPSPFPDGTTYEGYWLWMHYIYRYVKSYKSYNCPTCLGGKFTGGYYWKGGKQDPEISIQQSKFANASYGYNRWLGRYRFEQRVTFSQITHPSITPLFADCPYYLIGPKYDDDGYANDFLPQGRHGGLANMTFVDGHAKAIKPSDWATDKPRSVTDPIWRKWDPLLQ
jgi:prepilin-type N-terminal cleavage/methylation domain-containing protein/prepilin-type processing-associated H-X9-DG protein